MTNSTFIKVCLEDEVKYANGLLELLSAERNALAKNNGKELENIAQQKRKLAEQLELSAGRRTNHLLETSGMASTDIRDYLNHCAPTENGQELNTLWQQLSDSLNQCREQNRLNGSILESSQRSIKQAIALLQGQGQEGELYGRAGKTVSSTPGHSFTRA